MIEPTVAKITNKIPITTKKFNSPVLTRLIVPPMALGIPETIPAKIIKLIPLSELFLSH